MAVSSQPTTAAAAAPSAPAANGGVTAEADVAEDKQAALDAELAKRKARAERFGITEPADGEGEDPQKKLDRAARFGVTSAGAPAGLGALDMALDDLKGKRGRGGKQRNPKDPSSAPSVKPAAAPAAAPTPAAQAEWEEKKRKRAERFGGAPTDDAAAKRTKA